jgi:hypothetical protein
VSKEKRAIYAELELRGQQCVDGIQKIIVVNE